MSHMGNWLGRGAKSLTGRTGLVSASFCRKVDKRIIVNDDRMVWFSTTSAYSAQQIKLILLMEERLKGI